MDFEQINPVFTTAKTTTHMLASMGVAHAERFERELGFTASEAADEQARNVNNTITMAMLFCAFMPQTERSPNQVFATFSTWPADTPLDRPSLSSTTM